MPKEKEPPMDPHQSTGEKQRKPWFRPNQSGLGWHPSSGKAWFLLLIIIAAIVVVVVLLRTGVI